MKIMVADRQHTLIDALKRIGLSHCEARDIFSVPADAVVSPANSFGFMDGGIDLAYSHRFGWGVQAALQRKIQDDFDGEMLVGQAVSVSTGDTDFPHLISAPTMRVPSIIADPNAVRLATRAAIRIALSLGCQSIVIPGMGTGCGQVKPEWAAAMMSAGIADALNTAVFPKSLQAAVSDHYKTFQ